MAQTKKTVTKTNDVVAANPAEAKLDRIIELLEQIAGNAKNIPFQGLDLSKLV